MKGSRPYIPLSVRVQVAERQLQESGSILWALYCSSRDSIRLGRRLQILLDHLFPGRPPQLDHDPALILRMRRTKLDGSVVYSPAANDPDHLIYREKADHLQKTTGRKPGAERTVTTKGSDIGLKTKFARLEKKTRPRTTIVPKGFGAKRKIPSRPFNRGKRP